MAESSLQSAPSCTFFAAVERVITNWNALKVAVENGMGHPHAQEKVKWLTQVVDEFFNRNEDLFPEETEDFIADILNNEFDTIVEDGSVLQVSQTLCRLFKLYSDKQTEEFESLLATLPISSLTDWKWNSQDEIGDDGRQTSQLIPEVENIGMELGEDDDGGWKVVKNSKKR